jgi:hypothetical protein
MIFLFLVGPEKIMSNMSGKYFECCREKLFVKLSKCEFGKTYIVYLGYIVGGWLKIDLSKVDVIVNWPKPTNLTEVRSFI